MLAFLSDPASADALDAQIADLRCDLDRHRRAMTEAADKAGAALGRIERLKELKAALRPQKNGAPSVPRQPSNPATPEMEAPAQVLPAQRENDADGANACPLPPPDVASMQRPGAPPPPDLGPLFEGLKKAPEPPLQLLHEESLSGLHQPGEEERLVKVLNASYIGNAFQRLLPPKVNVLTVLARLFVCSSIHSDAWVLLPVYLDMDIYQLQHGERQPLRDAPSGDDFYCGCKIKVAGKVAVIGPRSEGLRVVRREKQP
jgi:hypothetical protein